MPGDAEVRFREEGDCLVCQLLISEGRPGLGLRVEESVHQTALSLPDHDTSKVAFSLGNLDIPCKASKAYSPLVSRPQLTSDGCIVCSLQNTKNKHRGDNIMFF